MIHTQKLGVGRHLMRSGVVSEEKTSARQKENRKSARGQWREESGLEHQAGRWGFECKKKEIEEM